MTGVARPKSGRMALTPTRAAQASAVVGLVVWVLAFWIGGGDVACIMAGVLGVRRPLRVRRSRPRGRAGARGGRARQRRGGRRAPTPDLWTACFEAFGKEVLAGFAHTHRWRFNAEQWNAQWRGDPMWLDLFDEVIGCTGLNRKNCPNAPRKP